MADDDLDEDESPKPKDEKPAAKGDGPHVVLRVILGTAGLLLVVGFFLPWLRLEMPATEEGASAVLAEYSGMELVATDDVTVRAMVGGDTQRYLLLLIPVFGLAMTAVGFMGFRWSGAIAAGLGLLLVGYGVVTVVIFFFQKTALGLWLILGGTFLSVVAGMFSVLRARGKSAKKTELALPED